MSKTEHHKIAEHACSVEDIYADLKTDEAGLTDEQALSLAGHYGKNEIPSAPPKPAWRRLLAQFHNVLIYVLIGSAAISLLLQHYVDSLVIFAVVIVNALVGFIQEGKAEDSLKAIMSMTRSMTMAIRNGVIETVDSRDLVPGDVVMLQAGDRVPADVRLFYCKDFRCDESALTGEAQPVSKLTQVLSAETPLAERKNMAYMGTMATYGVARGVVTKTGQNTQIGEISKLVSRVSLIQTPLQAQLNRFAHQLTIGIAGFAGLTMLLGMLLYQYPLSEMFQAAIGIAVSSIPEGLPAIVTIALAIGVQRMAKNNALVRRLPAVEVLGSVDIICSDKTGTLTANAMTARELDFASRNYRIGGEGYKPEGLIECTSTHTKILVEQDPSFTQACLVALLCNDARIERENNQWLLHGDPTEGALMVLAMKHGLNYAETHHDWPRIDLLPFESDKRYMATLHHNLDGDVIMMVKGAPDRIIGYATQQLGNNGLEPCDPEHWHQLTERLAEKGMRVIALAEKRYQHRPEVISHSEVEAGLTLIALVGISDPPRLEAIESIQQCHQAGIRVKMITGDSPITAKAIGDELGLNTKHVMTGQALDAMTEQELIQAVEHSDVFARTSPANKLQLVNALQNHNHVVAMTGDGVNDAPALKKSNIGVAMGLKGTDAAKEAADFVLTDDNFSTIAKAVEEGRTVYDNIVKSIVFVLPTNLAEALVIFIAIMLGRMMPITPAQILWINMITAVTLALALAFEKPEAGIMRRPPRPIGQGLFSFALLIRMLVVGLLGATVIFGLFFMYRENGYSIEYTRAVTVNALVFVEVFYLLNCRFLYQSIFSTAFFDGIKPTVIAILTVIGLQLVFSYSTLFQHLFAIEPIQLNDWLIIIMASAPVVFIVEIEKSLVRRFSPIKSER
jgi:magnesium-transporting ATPase (P-type)